jgi:hypothetical protein
VQVASGEWWSPLLQAHSYARGFDFVVSTKYFIILSPLKLQLLDFGPVSSSHQANQLLAADIAVGRLVRGLPLYF